MDAGRAVDLRPATASDAQAGCIALRRSITELCQADHGDDPAVIAAWTANKTPDRWNVWLARPDASLLVVSRAQQIVGVGMTLRSGSILLNYVAPESRGTGVSEALLRAMEEICAKHGAAACTLETTRTAERFYRARGYVPDEAFGGGVLGKRLAVGATPARP